MEEEMEETVVDTGDMVFCAYCGVDYTNSDESGGALIGSDAACPNCAPDAARVAKERGETIDAVCPPDKSFKEWVLGFAWWK